MKVGHATTILTGLALTSTTLATSDTNCQPNTWRNLTSLPTPRQEHTAVALNKTTIVVIGGITTDAAGNFNSTDLVQFYDIPTDTWRTGPCLPYAVNHPNAAVVNGKLYLLGGLSDGPVLPPLTFNWLADRRSYVYESQTSKWSPLESMPPGMERGSAVLGVLEDMIYVAGGMTVLMDQYQDTIDTVIAYNITSAHWQRLDPPAAILPAGRQHAVGSVVGNTFYLLGGRYFGQEGVRGTVFELNLRNLTSGWRTSSGHMPTPRGGLSGDAVNGKWYTFGGEGSRATASGVYNQSEAFDIETQKWVRLPPMTVPRHGTHAATVDGKIYIPGGGLQQDGKPYMHNGTTTYSGSTNHFDAYCV